jgi:hypothetical protein
MPDIWYVAKSYANMALIAAIPAIRWEIFVVMAII